MLHQPKDDSKIINQDSKQGNERILRAAFDVVALAASAHGIDALTK